MALTERQKQRVYYHLRYTQLTTPTTLSLGDPSVTMAKFRLDQNMANVLPITEVDVIQTIDRLDCIDAQLDQMRASAPWVSKVGSTSFDFETGKLTLDAEYRKHQLRLADQLASQINPVSESENAYFGGVVEGDMH